MHKSKRHIESINITNESSSKVIFTTGPGNFLEIMISCRIFVSKHAICSYIFLSFFFGFRRPNSITGLSGWRAPIRGRICPQGPGDSNFWPYILYLEKDIWKGHLGSFTVANWVSFDFNVSYSSCWGYSLINTLKLKRLGFLKFVLVSLAPKKVETQLNQMCNWDHKRTSVLSPSIMGP